MKKYFVLLTILYCTLLKFAIGSTTIHISSGTKVVAKDNLFAVATASSFVNNGSYIDNSGTFSVLKGIDFSGNGLTSLYNLAINNNGTTNFNTTVSVTNTATIIAGSVNAGSGNLYIRSDLNGNANLVNNGILTGTVKGLIVKASSGNGTCPSFSSTLSLNISGSAMQYQWQSSSDSIIWTNISSANSSTYNVTVSRTTFYRCVLSTNNSSFTQSTRGVKLSITGVVPTWYLDADNDGYYVSSISACSSPGVGYNQTSTIGGDCDDTNPAINPGAVEINDDIDNNCDSQVDEGFCNPIANFTAVYNAGTNQIDISYSSYTTTNDTFYIVRSGYNYVPIQFAMSNIDGIKTYSYTPGPTEPGTQVRCWVSGKCKMNTTLQTTGNLYVNIPGGAVCASNVATIGTIVSSSCSNAVTINFTGTAGTWGNSYQIAYRKISPTTGAFKYSTFVHTANSGNTSITLSDGAGNYEFMIRRRCNTTDQAYGYFSEVKTYNLSTYTACTRITGVTASYKGCKKIVVKWPASNCNVQSYTVRYWLNGSSTYWAGVANVTADSIIFNNAVVGNNKTYRFYVQTKYCNGTVGVNSDTATVTYNYNKLACLASRATAVNENNTDDMTDETLIERMVSDAITLYPNPSNGQTELRWSEDIAIAKVELYNVTGQLVSNYTIENLQSHLTINEPNLMAGHYLLILKDKDGAIVEKKNWIISNK